MAAIAQSDSTANLLNLLTALKGQNSTQTTQTNVSAAGVNALLQQILGGSQGLAAVAGGAHAAGLYNSSTNQLLVNDLATRAAGEVAKASASTTTTANKGKQISGNDLIGILGAGAAKSILGPTIAGVGKKLGVDQWGNQISNALGFGDGMSVAGNAADFGPPSSLAGSLADYAGSLGGGADVSDFQDLDLGGVSEGVDAATSSAADVGTNVAADTTEEAGGDFLSSLFGG